MKTTRLTTISFAITCLLGLGSLAAADENGPVQEVGSFSELVSSVNDPEPIVLEGPMLNGPQVVPSNSIRPYPGSAPVQESSVREAPLNRSGSDVPSIIQPDPGQIPSNPFSLNPTVQESPVPPTPRLDGPGLSVPADVAPMIPDQSIPQSFTPPPTQSYPLPPNLSPGIGPPGVEPYRNYDCPFDGQCAYERSRLRAEFDPYGRALDPYGRVSNRYLPAPSGCPESGCPFDNYVPYGGAGIDRGYDRDFEYHRSEVYRPSLDYYRGGDRDGDRFYAPRPNRDVVPLVPFVPYSSGYFSVPRPDCPYGIRF